MSSSLDVGIDPSTLEKIGEVGASQRSVLLGSVMYIVEDIIFCLLAFYTGSLGVYQDITSRKVKDINDARFKVVKHEIISLCQL